MKTTILSLFLALVAMSASAQTVTMHGVPYGSGIQDQTATEAVETYPGSGLYHAPQYMPGYPTAAPLWPAVIDVNCKEVPKGLDCDGYPWSPAYGRGEYVFFRAHVVKPPAPVVIYKEVEVPVKRGRE